MPLLSYQPRASIRCRCIICKAENDHPVASLTLMVRKDGANIRLPVCKGCGAVEFLSRTTDACPDAHKGSPFDVQRRVVNALSGELITAGRVDGDASALLPAKDLPKGAPPYKVAWLQRPVTQVPRKW